MSTTPPPLVIDAEEEAEVRCLLGRHRNRIVLDLEQSDLVTVLVKSNVISVITEALLINFSSGGIEDQQRRCNLLIDTIAKGGFQKFKEFCYAIEEECPELIQQMINDGDKTADPANGTKELRSLWWPPSSIVIVSRVAVIFPSSRGM